MKYYSDSYATIEWDATIKCVKTTLTGIPKHSLHYRLIQRKRLEFIALLKERFASFSILTDTRKAGPLIADDVNFFRTRVVPRLASFGITKVAFVEPESIFTKMVLREILDDATPKLKVEMFRSEEEAHCWLQNKLEVVL